MIPGLRGSLLSHDALEASRGLLSGTDPPALAARHQIAGWQAQIEREAGPAWPARIVFDRVAVPFCRMLGFDVVPMGGDVRALRALLRRDGVTAAALTAFPWGQDGGSSWRESVRSGIGIGVRWCYCFAGPSLRIYDGDRTHSRRFAELDLAAVPNHPAAFAVAWTLVSHPTLLDEAVDRSERHRASVRESLQLGVHDALGHLTRAFATASTRRRRGTADTPALLDESLVVIYRILFLLFAEARGLVPAWHPVFRDSYTIDSLRAPVETLPRPRGVWEALQAIARMAHRGCQAGSLRVPPFNGRLFSPSEAPLADSIPLDDAAVRQTLLALTTRRTGSGRERIAYGDLGVEQLGGVYERVLDYEVDERSRRQVTLVRGGRRKATGSFYTPRSLTEYLVRRTLAPLTEEASAAEILRLRVLDPAMGSGAFLVAACRYLAAAYEAATIREEGLNSGDLSETDRAGFRRTVAQHCLFGVDVNPMSVQLARLSLWLTTLAGDRPLTFFDHHLRAGNSLVGVSLAVVRQRRPGRRTSHAPLPLLDDGGLDDALAQTVTSREVLRNGLEDTVEQVRAKERLFASIQARGAPIARWKAIADLWCASWFENGRADRPRGASATTSRGMFDSLIDSALGRVGGLSESVVEEVLRRGRDAARAERFFHWELEFPEVLYGSDGAALERPGFDAVIGNPPWEMVRGDSGDAVARERASDAGSALTRFARDSGIYRAQGAGHANLYQMFVERSLSLLRRDGRLGLVLPSGFAVDHGCAALRRQVFRSTDIDSFVVVENREALFPIHRGLKFILLTLTKGPFRLKAEATESPGGFRLQAEGTTILPLRCGLRSAADFDRLPDTGQDPGAVPVSLRLIEQLSGEQFAVPELRTPLDLRIAGEIAFGAPAAGGGDGWRLRFGRELNATDDRPHFNTKQNGLPVVEGKQIHPFVVDLQASRHHITAEAAGRLLPHRGFEESRVAYRDVASATNKLTLIAALLPAGTVTTHTLFCLKTRLDDDAKHFVAGMLNSYVANYLVRLRVSTHVTVAIVERLPLPKPSPCARDFRIVAGRARQLTAHPNDLTAHAELQAAAARLYRLDIESFDHVLATLPLVDGTLRAAARSEFIRTI